LIKVSRPSRLRVSLVQCLIGFGGGVGAGVLGLLAYAFVPALGRAGNIGRTGGIPGELLLLVFFPLVGTIVGAFGGTVLVEGRQRRRMWLGTFLGAIAGIGLAGVLPFLHLHPVMDQPMVYLSGNLALTVLGATLGALIALQPANGNPLWTGLTCGGITGILLGFMFAALLPLPTTGVPEEDAQVTFRRFICGLYAFVSLSLIGTALGFTARRRTHIRLSKSRDNNSPSLER